MTTETVSTHACPVCAEQIQKDARKCRFCGEWLEGGHQRPPVQPSSQAWHPKPALPESGTTSGMAIASLLCALLGGGVLSIPAVILGLRAKRAIEQSNGAVKGRGVAIVGSLLGALQLIILAVVGLMILVNSQNHPGRSRAPLPLMSDGEYAVEILEDELGAFDVTATKNGPSFTYEFSVLRYGFCAANFFHHGWIGEVEEVSPGRNVIVVSDSAVTKLRGEYAGLGLVCSTEDEFLFLWT
jgi:hypothetical protein